MEKKTRFRKLKAMIAGILSAALMVPTSVSAAILSPAEVEEKAAAAAAAAAESEDPILTTTTGSALLKFVDEEKEGNIGVYTDDFEVITGAGVEAKPEVSVYDYWNKEEDWTLVRDKDYTVQYSDNTQAGTGKVTVTGAGDYEKNEISRTFTILIAPGDSALNVEGFGNEGGFWYKVTNKEGDKDHPLNVAFVKTADVGKIYTTTGSSISGSAIWYSDLTEIASGKSAEIQKALEWKDAENGFQQASFVEGQEYSLVFSYHYYISEEEAFSTMTTTFTPAKDQKTVYYRNDGYKVLKLQAQVKTNNTVKVSWKKKNGYKYFTLYKRDESAANGWKRVLKNGTATSYTEKKYKNKVADGAAPEVYMLECRKKKSGDPDCYIMPVAPRLFYAENGYDATDMEMCFSKVPTSDRVSYRLQLSDKDDLADSTEGKDFSTEFINDSSIEYKVSKSVTLPAIRASYYGDENLKPNTMLYKRVRTVFTFQGLEYVSAPSNQLKGKSGPEKLITLDIAGLKDFNDQAKNAANALNYVRLNNTVVSGSSIVTPAAVEYAHGSNTGADLKNGWVFFYVPKETTDSIAKFELIRLDKQYGAPKSLKKITKNTKDAFKVEVTEDDELYSPFYELWCVHHTSGFIPEKEYFYAVRGLTSEGAVGGFADALSYTVKPDKVQNLAGTTGDADKVTLTWDDDKCARYYYVYRSKKSFETADEADNLVFSSENFKKIGKVKVNKNRTNCKYNDTKISVRDKYFAYAVKPVYSTASKASKLDYNSEYASVIRGKITVAGTKVDSFIAKSTGLNSAELSWNRVKGIGKYSIQYSLDGAAYKDFKTYDTSKKTGAQKEQIELQSSWIGKKIKFRIQTVGSNGATGEKWTVSNTITSKPHAATNLRLTKNGSNQVLTWDLASADVPYASSLTYEVKFREGTGAEIPYNVSSRSLSFTAPKAGVSRTYTVTVLYGSVRSDAKSISYTQIDKINLYYENGAAYDKSSVDTTVGQWIPLSAAGLVGGNIVPGADIAASSSNSGIVTVTTAKSGNYTKITLNAKASGTANITLSSGGVTKIFKVNVK